MAGITEAQLANDKKLLRRLVLSQDDFLYVKQYAELILSQDWRSGKDEIDKRLLYALNMALIVSYWRPFSKNGKAPDTLPTLRDTCKKSFSPDEKALHERVGKFRNKAVAHSDPSVHQLHVAVDDLAGITTAVPTSRNVHVPLSVEDIEALLGMVKKLTIKILDEQIRVQEQLPAGTQF